MSEKTLDDILKRLDILEVRTKSLEKAVFKAKNKEIVSSDEFEGLAGGINKLISEHFFDEPKTLREIISEMERQGYFYSPGAINTALRRDFMKKKGILTRVGQKGNWRWVLRK